MRTEFQMVLIAFVSYADAYTHTRIRHNSSEAKVPALKLVRCDTADIETAMKVRGTRCGTITQPLYEYIKVGTS